MQVDCEIRGAAARQARGEILHDPDLNAYNSFDNPNRVIIRPHPVAVENGRLRLALPAMSVATVTLQVG
jgi:alpha-N-arabinofuranosidase